MTWKPIGNEMHFFRGYERVYVLKRDDFPDMILAMCKVLKEVK